MKKETLVVVIKTMIEIKTVDEAGKVDWEKTNAGNEVLSCDGYYVSYNPKTGVNYSALTDLGNMLGGNLVDGEETALYIKNTNKWHILEGDFRIEYKAVFPDVKKSKKVYEKHKKHSRSNWSTD